MTTSVPTTTSVSPVSPTRGTGYHVDPNALHRLSETLRTRAEAVRAALRELSLLPVPTEDILGDAGALAAYQAMSRAWRDELDTLARGLDDAAGKLTDSAHGYQSAEDHLSASMSGPRAAVDPGGSQPADPAADWAAA